MQRNKKRQVRNGKAKSKMTCYFCDELIKNDYYTLRGLLYTSPTGQGKPCTEYLCERCFKAAPSGYTTNGNRSYIIPLELSL